MNKKLIYEILFIVIVPVILGVTYHALIRDPSKRLAWFREQPVVPPANPIDIFGKDTTRPSGNVNTNPSVGSVTTVPPNKPGPQGGQPPVTHGPDTVAPPPTNGEVVSKVLSVTYEQVVRLNADESVLFFDARNEHEFAEGTIPRAKNIYAMDFEKHIPYILGLPDKNVRIVVFCGGGDCDLSHELSDKLIQFGFKRVFIYLGGYTEWKAKQGK